MGSMLPEFDDSTLTLIEESLNGAYTVDEDGTHHLVGAEFSLNGLLEFWSGYDESKAVHTGYIGDIPLYEYPDVMLSQHDLIRGLVAEIRRLRS